MPVINKPNQHFDAVTYTGAGAGTVITTGFYPDFAWMKNRTAAFSNFVQDSVRGGGVYLLTDATFADDTVSPSSTFSSTGITINGLSSYASSSSYNFVLWAWKANAGSTVTNTAGSITSTVSANPTAGFSIATLTTQASGTGTFGHGLGVAPSMVICKYRSTTSNWFTWHTSITGTEYLTLNTTTAKTDNSVIFSAAPTSTVVNLGTAWGGSGQIVAYCFAPIAGYSAFGSYTGNGSTDGPFIFTGFRPRFVMTKRTDSSSGGNWTIIDGARNPYNVTNLRMYADTNDADGAGNIVHDFVSNGFKVRQGDSSTNNISGATYIYMAFAEAPFKYARSR
jgi:hypothetical protein